ncbi:MAG: hypothetical protein ABIU54_00820, partial [Candidatus Eisenbacteria bacterium]
PLVQVFVLGLLGEGTSVELRASGTGAVMIAPGDKQWSGIADSKDIRRLVRYRLNGTGFSHL